MFEINEGNWKALDMPEVVAAGKGPGSVAFNFKSTTVVSVSTDLRN